MLGKLDYQNVSTHTKIPSHLECKRWIKKVLIHQQCRGDICLRIVDQPEMILLNQTYRQKKGPTNVLAFPHQAIGDNERQFLGDLIICAPIVLEESIAQDKPVNAHWAHLIIHGTLHLLGYDHYLEEEAQEMEALEIKLLSELNITNPYQERF